MRVFQAARLLQLNRRANARSAHTWESRRYFSSTTNVLPAFPAVECGHSCDPLVRQSPLLVPLSPSPLFITPKPEWAFSVRDSPVRILRRFRARVARLSLSRALKIDDILTGSRIVGRFSHVDGTDRLTARGDSARVRTGRPLVCAGTAIMCFAPTCSYYIIRFFHVVRNLRNCK